MPIRHLRAAALCLALLPASAALAQTPSLDPARVAAAKDLVAATGGMEQARTGYEQMMAAMISQIRGQNPAEADKFKAFMDRFLAPDGDIAKTYFSETLAAFTTFYAGNFTVAELNEIKTFQGSATGKKFQAKAPEMMSAMAPAMMKMQQSLVAGLQKEMGKP